MHNSENMNQIVRNLQHRVDEQTSELRRINLQLQEEISKRQLLEERLRSSDQLLEEKIRSCEATMRATFEGMTDIILVINTRGRQLTDIDILPTNPICFYEPSTDLISQTVEQFFQDKTANTWFRKVLQALDTKQRLNFDYSLSFEEQEVWFSATISPFSENSVLWVARDISDVYDELRLRKLAEERFQLLERAIAASNNGILICDAQAPDNPIIYVNSGFERITGYTASELMNQNCRILQGSDKEQPALEQLRSAIAAGTDTQVVLRNYRKDGSLFWNEFCLTPVRDATGCLTHFIGIQTDITERKQAQIELERQNQRLQQEIQVRQRAEEEIFFLVSTTQAIAETDDFHSALSIILRSCCETIDWDFGEAWIPNQDSGLLECSLGWYVSDPSLEEFRTQSLTVKFAPNFGIPGRIWLCKQPEWIEDISIEPCEVCPRSNIAAAAGLKASFGVPILFNDQVLAILVFYKKAASPRQRHLVELINAVAAQLGSLIQRKQTEEALRITQEKYHSIVENAVEGIFQATPSGQYLSANPALARIYGYDSPEDLINSIQDISRQLYLNPNRYKEFVAAIEADNEVKEFESLVQRKDGTVIWIAENTRAVRDCAVSKRDALASKPSAKGEQQGKLLYYEGTVSDVTERKLIEEALKFEQEQTKTLLLNLLPAPIAKRLQDGENPIADKFEEVSVLFADLVGFTEFSSKKTPEELVSILNIIFSEFDKLAQRYGLEKIKTIGDAYMVVGGLPIFRPDHARSIAQMALAMQTAIANVNTQIDESFKLRIGINIGPVVAGVMGLNKFIYDLWGDTVNTASRMEGNGIPGEIQVTTATYELLKEEFLFEQRGRIPIKGKGEMTTYLLRGQKF